MVYSANESIVRLKTFKFSVMASIDFNAMSLFTSIAYFLEAFRKLVFVDQQQYISTTLVLMRHAQYNKKKGMIGLGIHSPEFSFEKNYTNMKPAVQSYGITNPVMLDSGHGTWNAYGNQYWPRLYLIDTHGYIRYGHMGEGGYDQT